MVPLIFIHYHGEVEIQVWEYLLSLAYILVLYMVFARRKNRMVKTAPEYRYYLWGLMAKLFSALIFSLIYFYYYPGGDSSAFYYSGVAMREMALYDPIEYLRQVTGDNSYRAWASYPHGMPRPYQYVFFDDRTFVMVAISSVLALFTFNSFLISTMLMASLSFFGVWACFRTFVGYFPQITGKLAIAFLFMPSSIFWGSAILKDTLAFSAACAWVHAVDELVFKKRNKLGSVVSIVVCAVAMVAVKPYVFMVLFPATMLWVFYSRIARLRNELVKFVLVPMVLVGIMILSFTVLMRMGGQLDKFALQGAMETIQIVQGDMIKYGTNSFDVGPIDGTWSGVLAKFPVATNAALFRPYIWEVNNVVMAMSGLENLWVLTLALGVLLKAGPLFTLRCIRGNPLILMSTLFALSFAFVVGLTTPNFGALVRFKIPMVPFFISSLYIVAFMARLERKMRDQGHRFDIRDHRNGTAHLGPDVLAKGRKRTRREPRGGGTIAGPIPN